VTILSVASTIAGGFVSGRSDDFTMPPIALNIYIALVGVVLALLEAIMAIGGGRSTSENLNEI
jgi:hypothetical protein